MSTKLFGHAITTDLKILINCVRLCKGISEKHK